MAQAEKRRDSVALAEVRERTVESFVGRQVILGADRGDPRTIIVSKLSIDQWLGVAHLAFKVAGSLSEQGKGVLAEAAKAKDGNWSEMLPVLLNKDSLLGLIALLAGVDEEWLARNFSMAETMELLDAVDEQEDLRRVIAPFQRIGQRWRSKPVSGAAS